MQVMKDSAPELNVSSSETEEDKEEAKPDGEKDPDFNQVRVEAAFFISNTECAAIPLTLHPSRPTDISALMGHSFLAPLTFP